MVDKAPTTANTWCGKRDYREIVTKVVAFCRDRVNGKGQCNILIPGCGRGRVLQDIACALEKERVPVRLFCVDIKEGELKKLIEFRDKRGNWNFVEWYIKLESIQSYLHKEESYSLIITLLFFHYSPDCWVNLLAELLEHLEDGGAFLFDCIKGEDYANQVLMNALDESIEMPIAKCLDDDVASTYFSASLNDEKVRNPKTKIEPETLKNRLKTIQSAFVRKLKTDGAFWMSAIKATDVSLITRFFDDLFTSNCRCLSDSFKPKFGHSHFPWVWGMKSSGRKWMPLKKAKLKEWAPFVQFEMYWYSGFKWKRFDDLGKANLRKNWMQDPSDFVIRAFNSIPWLLSSAGNGNYSIPDAMNFAEEIAPNCLLQAVFSSGILEGCSGLDNVFLCFNSPDEKKPLVRRLFYASRSSEANETNGSAADRFYANACYHRLWRKKSLSRVLFNQGNGVLVFREGEKPGDEDCRAAILANGIRLKEVPAGMKTFLSCDKCHDIAGERRFMNQWDLGCVKVSDLPQSKERLYKQSKKLVENLKSYYDECQNNKFDDFVVPLDLMQLKGLLFIPFSGYRTLGNDGKIERDVNSFMGVCVGLRELDAKTIHEAIRVSRLVGKMAVRITDMQLSLHWCHRTLQTAIQSAIGSIMSRNGSHNIGSHVLAALSHNVGTMPDDRVLYQYIQHRMDYIATVTTESPSWAASTKFVGEMMRTFMSQRHLLEYIASSEGLHAYRFQDPNIDPKNQKQTIQIHVRYGKKDAVSDGSKVRFRELFDFKGPENPLDPVNDVMLAIPGGVVGQHAFFTIIENVIRNAAKHGWSSRTERERTNANLEIYIDAVDDISKKDVTFRIWDNMSHVRVDQDLSGLRKKIGVPVAKKYLSSEQVSKLLDRYAEETESGFKGERLLDGDKIPLHWRQQILMDQRIIQANGTLRRENWGMAEMKISAGYLQRRTIGQIGGLDALTEKDDFIVRAIAVPEDKVYHLGYEFNIPRPKRILILLKDETLPSNEAELNRQGIYFLRNSEARTAIADWDNGKKTDKFAAEYLVIQSPKALFKSSDIITRFADVPFPFRVLTCEDLSFAQKENQDECLNKGKKRICAMVHKIGDVKWSENNTWDVDKISSDVLKAWREHCLSRRGMETDMMPHVNTRGESGAGQALISNRDIWQVLFTEHFHSTLDSFLKSEQVEKDLDAFCQWLLGHRSEYEFTAFENVEIDDLDKSQVVARQFKHLLSKISNPQFVKVRLDEVLKSQIADVQRGPEMLRAIYDKYRKDPRPDVGRLIMHFKHAFEQLDVMLRKYEERIVTLPNSYSLSKGALENQPSFDKTSGRTDTSESSGISYNRHHKVTDADYVKTYTEPLSGSQSYLNDLVVYQRHYISCQGNFDKLGSEDRFLNVRLVENGLMRILFVDERVSRFLRGHEKSRQYYRAMNMWCVDETSLESNGKEEAKETVAADPLSANGKLLTFVRAKDKADVFQMLLGAIKKWQGQGEKDFKFDMIVIHQGVLDKWCKGDYNAGSADGMRKIIEALKKLVNYVIITTGRGMPANIPSCARILPFSTIEGTLFKLYPEKLTLVNSIMNILPLGGKQNG